MNVRLLTLAALSCAAAAPADAQRWRTLDAARQVRDSAPLSVRVEYAAGHVDVRPASGNTLYNLSLRYDAERGEPVSRYDSLARTLDLGMRGRRFNYSKNEDAGDLKLQLAPSVPMDLSLELGAVDGELQLGGLTLTDLAVKAGAAELTLRFDAPNRTRMRSMSVEVGAASVKLVHAANAGAERVKANVGVGSLDVDLSGPLARDIELSANVAMGELILRVAPEVGVYVDASTFLADMKSSGLIKREDGWYSADFEKSARHVRVRFNGFLGSFKLKRAG